MAPPSKSDDESQPLLYESQVNQVRYTEDGHIPNHHNPAIETELSDWECFKVMAGVWLGTFLSAFDMTVVATLSTSISDSFNALSLLSWVASGYIIANAITQPISGKLSDIYGRRAGFVISIVLFSAGNVICALAQSASMLIFGRVVAGLGGGCLNTISTFVGSDLVPLRKRGVWQGIGNLQFGIGLAIGGVAGGIINDLAGWRWAFWIQVPFTIICLVQVLCTLKIPPKKSEGSKLKRVDFIGSITLITALVLLLFALNSGGNTVSWTSPVVYVSLSLSMVFLGLFIFVETKVPEPIIPMRQLAHRTVLSACFSNWFGSMTFMGLMFYIPIYFQVRGDSTSTAGLRMIPISLGAGTGSIAVGIMMKIWGKYYWLNAGVAALYVMAYAAQTRSRLDSPWWPIMIETAIEAAGHSGLLTVTLTAFVAAVEHEYQAVVTAASYAFRSTGGSIGVTICSAVFQHILYTKLWDQLGEKENAAAMIPKIVERLDFVKSLEPSWQQPVLQIYMDALTGVFWTIFATASLAAACSLFMKEHKLHTNLGRREST